MRIPTNSMDTYIKCTFNCLYSKMHPIFGILNKYRIQNFEINFKLCNIFYFSLKSEWCTEIWIVFVFGLIKFETRKHINPWSIEQIGLWCLSNSDVVNKTSQYIVVFGNVTIVWFYDVETVQFIRTWIVRVWKWIHQLDHKCVVL